jgi:hypothetical protein
VNIHSKNRKNNVIDHSQFLSENNTELALDLDIPSGTVRANRRAQQIAKQAGLGYG